jgi:hypothetical protein
MKTRITRYLLTGAGLIAMAAVPASASDLSRDYNRLHRENADIRHDQRRLHEDLEHGRYYQAERERRDLRHDYAERNAQVRDIRRDERWRY